MELGASSSYAAISMASSSSSPVSRFAGLARRTTLRYDLLDQRCLPCSSGIQMKTRNPITTAYAASADDSPTRPKSYKEVIKPFRQLFAREISTQSNDSDISIAKVLLYIAAEDEAFLAFTREIDALSFQRERETIQDSEEELESVQDQSYPSETDSDEQLQLGGKSIPEWLSELDAISKQVEAELVTRGINSCDSLQVLEAVNTVLFDMRGFKRTPKCSDEDPKDYYLHSVLNSRCSSAFLFSVIYIEVCQRLGVPIVGARVGENFLVWPKTENPDELFEVAATSGKSLFATVNGKCVDDPKAMASELTGESLQDFDVVTNRDIIGIALANLMRVHWRCGSKPTPRQMLTAPLSELDNNFNISNFPLLRPQDLRLAIAAAERMLILDPNNWRLRRQLGMMYYYVRQCREAITELSICIANFEVEEEEEKELKRFVEKLHRFFSMMSPLDSGRLAVR